MLIGKINGLKTSEQQDQSNKQTKPNLLAVYVALNKVLKRSRSIFFQSIM